MEKAAAASHPSEGDFPLRYWRLFIGGGPLRNSGEKTAESNNGQLLGEGGKHIRPQDRDFSYEYRDRFFKKIASEPMVATSSHTCERVRADPRWVAWSLRATWKIRETPQGWYCLHTARGAAPEILDRSRRTKFRFRHSGEFRSLRI